jgi:hypothetical protein
VAVVGVRSGGGAVGSEGEEATAGRHRQDRSPARGRALKVLYGDDELAAVQQAAALAGLRPSSYVAAAALAMARQVAVDGPGVRAPGRRSASQRPGAAGVAGAGGGRL